MRFPATRTTPRVAPLLFTVRREIPSNGAGPLSSSSMKFSSIKCIQYLPARVFSVRSVWGRTYTGIRFCVFTRATGLGRRISVIWWMSSGEKR